MKQQSTIFLFAAAVIAFVATTSNAFAPRTMIMRRLSSQPTASKLYNQKDDEDLRQAEDQAAVDAHDCPDPAMEAAAEERAVMMADAMHLKVGHEIHLGDDSEGDDKPAAEPHMTTEKITNQEMEQAEEDAAVDAHDCSDAGMEAAAEERAVMLAYEMAQKKKAEAAAKKRKEADKLNGNDNI